MNGDWAEKIAIDILGACSCHEAYTSRNMIAPDCVWHDCSEELIAALRKARREGMEAAITIVKDEPELPMPATEAQMQEFQRVGIVATARATCAVTKRLIAARIRSLLDQEPSP